MVRDKKLARFGEIFDNVLQRKGLILGENTAIPKDVELSISASASTVKGSIAVVEEEEEEDGLLPSKKAMSLTELTEILKQQSQAELTATAAEAIRRGSKSILTATGR